MTQYKYVSSTISLYIEPRLNKTIIDGAKILAIQKILTVFQKHVIETIWTIYRLSEAFATKIQFHAVDFPLSHATTFLQFFFSIPDRNGSTLALQKSFLPFTAKISGSGPSQPPSKYLDKLQPIPSHKLGIFRSLAGSQNCFRGRFCVDLYIEN